MFITEQEALKQSCPFIVYLSNPHNVASGHEHPIVVNQGCMASGCTIAWRWKSDEKRLGYCGAAGKPTQ